MPITPPPPRPDRREPALFADRGDAWHVWWAAAIVEENALEANVNAKEATVVLAEAICVAAKNTAAAAANYKGPWASQTGAANVPYAVSHLGSYWQLVSNLVDVTTKTPGTDPEWLLIPTGITWSVKSSATNAVKGNGYICDTSGAAFTLTLPAAPAVGDIIKITDGAGTFDTANLTIGRNALKIMGLAEDMVVSTKYAALSLVYASAALGWRIA